jgi:spore coat protein U-like protein
MARAAIHGLGLAALILAGWVPPAFAETSKPFTVGATIAQGCAIATDGGGGGTFGNIDLGTVSGVLAQSVSGSLVASLQTGLQIDCTPGTSANVTADQGDQPSGGVRRLVHATQAASLVPYQLFANNSQTPWTSQSVPVSFAAGVQHQALPITAVATLSGPTRGGGYSDIVRITVTW